MKKSLLISLKGYNFSKRDIFFSQSRDVYLTDLSQKHNQLK